MILNERLSEIVNQIELDDRSAIDILKKINKGWTFQDIVAEFNITEYPTNNVYGDISDFNIFILGLMHKAYKAIDTIDKSVMWLPESHVTGSLPDNGSIGFLGNDIYMYKNNKFIKKATIIHGKRIRIIISNTYNSSEYFGGIGSDIENTD